MTTYTQSINSLTRLLRESAHAVAFTGAGISTESGIPDFRGPGGLWSKIKPIQFQDFVASEEVRQESWKQWFERGKDITQARPNTGHDALTHLVNISRLQTIITQNVDNLHQESGVPADRVVELHGNATYAKCLTCESRYEHVDMEKEYRTNGMIAPCGSCGGIIKNATISFGQAMPETPMTLAEVATMNSDLFIVLGSSLTVFPAAAFPQVAQANGAKLVIINQQSTPLDHIADLVLNEAIGAVMCAVINNLNQG